MGIVAWRLTSASNPWVIHNNPANKWWRSQQIKVIARVIDTARWDAMAPSPEQAKAEAADESSAAWLDWRSIRQLLLPYPVVASGG